MSFNDALCNGQPQTRTVFFDLSSVARSEKLIEDLTDLIIGNAYSCICNLNENSAIEVVPGITNALAAACYGGIPPTHRDCTPNRLSTKQQSTTSRAKYFLSFSASDALRAERVLRNRPLMPQNQDTGPQ